MSGSEQGWFDPDFCKHRCPVCTSAGKGKHSLHRIASMLWGDNAASWAVAAPSPGTVHLIVGENFYNNSAFDGRTAAATLQDGNAIATDKQPLRLGQQASFDNYTSLSRGLTHLMHLQHGSQYTPLGPCIQASPGVRPLLDRAAVRSNRSGPR